MQNYKSSHSLKNIFRYFLRATSSGTKPYNVLFLGSDEFALTCLKSLKKNMDHSASDGRVVKSLQVACLQQSDRCIYKYSQEHAMPLHVWPHLPKQHLFDVAVVVSFGKLIPDFLINSFPFGMINIHASLLPSFRGAAPIARAIEAGSKTTGVTIMKIAPNKFDHGLILDKSDELTIENYENSSDVNRMLADVGANLCVDVLKNLPFKLDNAEKQDESKATSAPKLSLKDVNIDWDSMECVQIWNKYRAYGFNKLFYLRCTLDGVLVRLANISICDELQLSTDEPPGSVIYHKASKRLLISCKNGFISCGKLLLDKRKPLTATDFYNGFMQVQLKRGNKIVFKKYAK